MICIVIIFVMCVYISVLMYGVYVIVGRVDMYNVHSYCVCIGVWIMYECELYARGDVCV